ncbi:hypothetical protein CYMTET_7983 [Cymbomonas tetramitiformis]|uniref:Uncharacterized protein n=1 Tax=Cymbomonas tetramitiformis TaxID=36881 RepID=A0AAE0GUI5_9CHLO|nr:hypothetical protein CYMTET_7983 [Cymbomonas tetramitiformis]
MAPRFVEGVARRTLGDAVESFERHVAGLPNMRIQHLALVPGWIPPVRTNPNVALNLNFLNMASMLHSAYEAVMRVNLTERYDIMLRIREDAAWYYPLVLDMLPRNVLALKSCNHWGGYNDKAWIGPFDATYGIMIRYYAAMWDANVTTENTEGLLKHVVDALEVSVYARTATFDQRTGVMSRFGLTLSDARRSSDGSICFTQSYWKGNRGELGCGERLARTVFAVPIRTCIARIPKRS